MEAQDIAKYWFRHFPYEPTEGQRHLIHDLSGFLSNKNKHTAFILKGYAGTGKTSIISSLVNILPDFYIKSVLLAPTGKAAKVFSQYSGKQATTIHKKLYSLRTNREGVTHLQIAPNLHKNTLFIVDEASMIPDQSQPAEGNLFGTQRLLDDLVYFVYQGENCKILLIGDTAQLPPVGLQISPALDPAYLKSNYHLDTHQLELTEVVRQSRESSILKNATNIRNRIARGGNLLPLFISINHRDTHKITGIDLEEKLHEAYSDFGAEDTIIVCRSNKRANVFNQEIRARILFKENEISTGDLMMVVRNNYFWLDRDDHKGFIANGEIIEIMSINRTEHIYGFHFADISIRFVDYPDEPDLDIKIMLDTIMLESPALGWKGHKQLGEEIIKDFGDIPSRRKRQEMLQQNPYFQAIQVKFAYALTCHKAQGGQWAAVFADQGYLTKEMIDIEYLRWLYTAVTRATRRLFLVNFNDTFFQ
ncbi:MAG: AAA family ATPase [Bacteroidota bacterium]|nr:AAA family ATPase [Bacteroidota bacterium]